MQEKRREEERGKHFSLQLVRQQSVKSGFKGVCLCFGTSVSSCQCVHVCVLVYLKGCMWLLGLCCDTCKAGYKLPVKASASHKSDEGVTHFLKMWIFIECVCVRERERGREIQCL